MNLQKKIPVSPKRIKETVLRTFASEGVKKSGAITVCFINDKRIRQLNLRFFGRNRPTDVIAFDFGPGDPGDEALAEIAVSTDTAIANAEIFKTSAVYELYLYVVHGILHILGYEDKNLKERAKMQRKAEKILTKLRIKEK